MYIATISNGNLETPIHDGKEHLLSGKITKGINTIDSFSFSMLPNNAGFSLINEFSTLVSVYNAIRQRYDFTGRVLHPEATMEESGEIVKNVTCENILGYLCDSQQPYVAAKNWTISGLFTYLINTHNSQVEEYKRFRVGNITATDSNDNLYVGIDRSNTWESIKSNLIDKIGGELQCRVESDGGVCIDYLDSIGERKETPIELSVNMRKITRSQDPTAYITRLIPLGCKLTKDGEETEERLDITQLNNGVNYIEDKAAVELYGIHVGYHTWDDVTDAGNLLRKARAWLTENNRVQVKYSVSALDLSLIGLSVDDFEVGNYHPIKNSLIGLDDTARIIKKTVDICNPVESSIEFGDNFKTLSEIQRDLAAQIWAAQKNVNGLKTDVKHQLHEINKIIEESKAFIGVASTDVLYYLSSSNTTLADGVWLTDPAEWAEGMYYWQKTVTTYTDGSTAESAPVCVMGEKGVGIASITEFYYLSTSKEEPAEGTWVLSPPEWEIGKYLWTRLAIYYTDGSTSVTEPICDSTWEAVAEAESRLQESFTTQIQQLSDSITLEVSGSLGSNASIILSAGTNKYTGELSLSDVRLAFANDPTAISISAGTITFNSGTIVINSENFRVDSAGNVTATNVNLSGNIKATSGRIGAEGKGWSIDNNSLYFGDEFATATAFLCTGSNTTQTIGGHSGSGWVLKAGSKFGVTKEGNLYCTSAHLNGSLTTTSGDYELQVTGGGLDMYYEGILCGNITSHYNGNLSGKGISLKVYSSGEYIMLSCENDEVGNIAYVVNNGWTSNYSEVNLFYASTRFVGKMYFGSAYGQSLYMRSFIKSVDADGNVGEELIGYSSDMVQVGSVGCATMLRGTSVYLKNTSTTVTSDRNAKNSIEALPDAYEALLDNIEPVRFMYNEGTSGRYHVGYIAQDVEAALTAAGLSTMDFAGFVDMEKSGNLGLMYDEFIALLHMKIKRLETRIATLENK